MTLGEQLKKLRNEKALSQPDLADLTGIEQSYLSKLENDKSMPSNDIFRKLLTAYGLSLADFIALFDRRYAETQLKQIPDIEHWLKQQQQSQMLNQRRYLYICSTLIVLALTLFYVGQSKILFPEVQFGYYSQGVVLAGEPKDIFDDWDKMIPREDVNNQLYYKKKMEMTQRKDEKFILSEKFLGKNYVVTLPKGLRLYRADSEKMIAQPINAWLCIAGVFFFVMGIMGFILERRVYKTVT
ncbi:helix-turn-helix domain-containing protein [Colwellia hornerae]|uniref:Helix-turn-helix transcriptional regulator n=1 Tax=Colwellia hornerae TaxID=89402 RepID=A0A5C6QC94_9GAMM|nr:helix-turn-helix transcriptional regulator [Colwellia hornerae]TWX58474.1 helix-turn-helix transcriptional regulator [Colwellia hornerae]TWX58710.1 helix-turn-helix transcriptional regulator [Colwellia hornerae]TWX66586.1 helix-turn-helix transcriptional regulator [Colwellia hornerae]